MKKFFVILCILLFTFPMYAFAAKSPTVENMIYSIPSIKFEMIDQIPFIMDIYDMLPHEELEGYTWCEAITVELDQEYEKVQWRLLIDFTQIEEAKVVIIGESIYIQSAEIINDMIIVDFTGLDPGTYYVCFFVK